MLILPDKVKSEIMAHFNCYALIPERVKALEAERAEIVARLMPRVGASMVKASRSAGTPADPTADAAAALADHPFIKKLDRLIAYWQEQRARVDLLLPMFTRIEREVVDLYIYHGPAEQQKWPSIGKEELRQVRRQIIRKAARCWGLW